MQHFDNRCSDWKCGWLRKAIVKKNVTKTSFKDKTVFLEELFWKENSKTREKNTF